MGIKRENRMNFKEIDAKEMWLQAAIEHCVNKIDVLTVSPGKQTLKETKARAAMIAPFVRTKAKLLAIDPARAAYLDLSGKIGEMMDKHGMIDMASVRAGDLIMAVGGSK